MALKAGRVGVRKDQVDNNGILNTSGITIPVATSTKVGGVKAVPKTEAMTKEVGVDENGKLYVEPSQGGGVAETGSGTLSSTTTSEGYCDYIVYDGVCYFCGLITTSSGFPSGTYTSDIVVTDMPHASLGSLTSLHTAVTAITAQSSYGSSHGCYGMSVDTSGNLRILARQVPASNKKITISGMYPVGDDFVSERLTLQNTTLGNIDAVYNDKYCFLTGNFGVNSAADGKLLCDDLPPCKAWIWNNVLADDTYFYNVMNLYFNEGNLYFKTSSNSRVDFGCAYLIDEEE